MISVGYSDILFVLIKKKLLSATLALRNVLNHDHGWARSLYLSSPNGKCISVMSKHFMVLAVYQGPKLTFAKRQM